MIIVLNKTKIFFYKDHIFFIGKSGLTNFNIASISSSLQISVGKTYVKLLVSNQNLYNAKNFILEKLNTTLSKLSNMYTKKILISGIGFRCWLYKKSNLNHNSLALKIGFSRDLCIQLPLCIKVITLKPTLILLKSFDKIKLNQFAGFLHSLRSPDVYKGKGLQYVGQKVTLKPGKHK